MHLELATGLPTPAHEDYAVVDHTDQMLAMWRQKNALRGSGTGSKPSSLHASSKPSGPSPVKARARGTTFTRLTQNERGDVAVQCRMMGLGVHATCEAVTRAVRREHLLSPLENIAGGDDHPFFYPPVDDYLDSYLAMHSSSASLDVASVSSEGSTGIEDYLYSTSSSSNSASSIDATVLLPEDCIHDYKEQRQDIIAGPATHNPLRTLDLKNIGDASAKSDFAEIAGYFHKGYQVV